jgi:cell division septation protein DedD
MIRDFSKEELAPAGNDTEVTLGIGALLAIGCGLFLVCGVCFGLGYAMGHRSSPDQSAALALPAQDTKTPVMPVGGGSKPGASGQLPAQVQPVADGSGTSADSSAQTEQIAADSGTVQAAVKPAVDSQVRSADGSVVQAGIQATRNQANGWMVQIAAVSHAEDAQVLVDALRKRGYEVTARHDSSDNLIHVQTGPFVNRNDANAMRQKLLNDGYNAIVQ